MLKVVETDDPAPVADTIQYNDGFGGASAPAGSRTVWLSGVRTGLGRPLPGREGNFTYPASASPAPSSVAGTPVDNLAYPASITLSASPVPNSFVGTPVDLRSPSLHEYPQQPRRPTSFLPEGRGVSAFFHSSSSLGSRGDALDPCDMVGRGDRLTGERRFQGFGGAAPAPFDGGFYRSPLGRAGVPAAGGRRRSPASSQSRR